MFHFKLRAKLNHVTKSFINTHLNFEKNIQCMLPKLAMVNDHTFHPSATSFYEFQESNPLTSSVHFSFYGPSFRHTLDCQKLEYLINFSINEIVSIWTSKIDWKIYLTYWNGLWIIIIINKLILQKIIGYFLSTCPTVRYCLFGISCNIQNNCILLDCFFAIHIICTFLMYWFEHKNYH